MAAAAPNRDARLSGRARALALEIAAEARAEWGYTSDIIARAFRTHRELGSGDRRRIAETVYALVRQDRRLDAIVDEVCGEEGAGALSGIARDELKLLVLELRGGLPAVAARGDARRITSGLRLGAPPLDLEAATAADAGLAGRKGLDREAVRLSFPTWLVERLSAELGGDEALALVAAMNDRAPLAVRANSVLASRDELCAALAEEGVAARPAALAETAVVLETRVNAFGLSAFRRGLFEVMDVGSQLVAELVAPPPGGRVLDACAGAGGKTLALAAALGGKGRVLALDKDGKKLEELRRRARRAGLSNVTARPVDVRGAAAALPAEARPGAWDRVLVDAPCSGLGTLRRNPEARWRLTPAAVKAFPARQLGLLVTYAPLVAIGGRLVYATCTVLADENEGVVQRFLAERDDFVRVPVKEVWGRSRSDALALPGDGSLRLYPHRHDTDGFFAVVLRRVR